MSSAGFSEREYENLVREGIRAARAGHRNSARRLLDRAARENPNDARVWLWLSGTTDDPDEQRAMLERAVAADPSNPVAQKGLAMIDSRRGHPAPDLPQQAHADESAGWSGAVPLEGEPSPAGTQTFECPNCGGRQQYDVKVGGLLCEYCGHEIDLATATDGGALETPFGPILRIPTGHRWAASLREAVCGKCGAHTAVPAGAMTQVCGHCSSNQLVESPLNAELLDPHQIALFRIDKKQALEHVRDWLARGLDAPDDLEKSDQTVRFRPAYHPFWIFDGDVEIRWSAEVRDSRSGYRQAEWRIVGGAVTESFDDVLVPGVSAMRAGQVAALGVFDLKQAVAFDPGLIAGWPALLYDRSPADASLLARESVLQRLRRRVEAQIEPGREKRSVQTGIGGWSGVTLRLVLLPVWTGKYRYRGEIFPVWVNGQTGAVGGRRPRDRVKVIAIRLLLAVVVVLAIGLLAWALYRLGVFSGAWVLT